jgi:hypothetical protein
VAPRLEGINPRRPQFTVDYVAILDVLDTNSSVSIIDPTVNTVVGTVPADGGIGPPRYVRTRTVL